MPKGIYKHKKISLESIQKRTETRRKNGWNKNPEKTKKKQRDAQSGEKSYLYGMKGEKSNTWKGGLPKCKDCNKQLCAYSAIQCNSCAKKGKSNPFYGKKVSKEHREKLKLIMSKRVGELHQNWKGGISRDLHSLSFPEYREWRMNIFKRDNFKCKIFNSDCKGQLQAHHILNWKDYPELRYEINNGITLCVAHHPRGRAKEKRLIPTFQELVSVSKVQNSTFT